MINLSKDQIKDKIVQEKQVGEEEVQGKIDKKLEELSGLISDEGAAHIVANEYGVDLTKKEGKSDINSLVPGMKGVEIAAKVIRKYEVRTFERQSGDQGKVSRCLIADESGMTMLVLWDDKASLLDNVKEEDIIQATKADVRENRGRKELHLAKDAELKVNPEGVEVNATAQPMSQEVQRKKIADLKEEDNIVELFVTVVQVFDPKFFESKPDMNGSTQGAVLNMFVDDGSDNMRTVVWKDQLCQLLNVDEKGLLQYKENPEKFEEVKTDLLGKMAKLTGRVSMNKMFGRLEFVVNKFDFNVDPEKEMNNISKEESQSKPDSQVSKEGESSASSEGVETQSEEQAKSGESVESNSKKQDDELEEEVMSLEDIDDI